MEISPQSIQLCADLVAARVAEYISGRDLLDKTLALQKFMGTRTYALLQNPASFLYYESAEYVEDMLEAEERGDWASWLME